MDRGRLAGQDEERGLERVLGIMVIAQNGPARRRDHGTMPCHQGREGRPVVRVSVARSVAPRREVRQSCHQPKRSRRCVTLEPSIPLAMIGRLPGCGSLPTQHCKRGRAVRAHQLSGKKHLTVAYLCAPLSVFGDDCLSRSARPAYLESLL